MENKKENKSQHQNDDAKQHDSSGDADDAKYTSTDKYLALEQPGVTFTGAGHPESNSDYFETANEEDSGKWKANGKK